MLLRGLLCWRKWTGCRRREIGGRANAKEGDRVVDEDVGGGSPSPRPRADEDVRRRDAGRLGRGRLLVQKHRAERGGFCLYCRGRLRKSPHFVFACRDRWGNRKDLHDVYKI